MKRRHFLQTSGLALGSVLIGKSLMAADSEKRSDVLSFPDKVTAWSAGNEVTLLKNGAGKWGAENMEVSLINRKNSIEVFVDAPKTALTQITLAWNTDSKLSSTILNDHWERTYGDVSWHKPTTSEIFPWYFMEITAKNEIYGFGVKTGANSFCSWQVTETGLSLTLDTRSGGNGVLLGNRTLKAAEIVAYQSDNNSPFVALKEFLKKMCDKPRMPKQPVYGINDWYFSYGNNSEKLIIEHTEMMAPMADGLKNRPFSVIDAGWFQNPPSSPNDCCWGDNMHTPDEKFGDMGKLAEKIRTIGMRPGIWTRPLCGSYKDPASLMLPMIKGREEKKPVLDPTIPENLEQVKNYFKLYNEWSYEMVKVDFTTFDIFGKWGFEMIADKRMTEAGWTMNENSKTNAEIVLELYKTIREAAGETYIIGCNTISHLSAGLFELNRIGDDTSGNEWERTRKMGVNTLAFRSAHQGTFYAADGDCVGLTPKVPWAKNKQWMELVAKSGTPLFISAQPEATGPEQKAFIKECFALAAQDLPVGEPLDWMENAFPKKWKLNGKVQEFDWNIAD
jgi:alpha-galactosidase